MSKSTKTDLDTFLAVHEKLVDRQLYDVPIDALVPDPDQPRKHFDEDAMAELQASIEKHSVLQPVIVRQKKDKTLVIVSGERRYRASKQAGKKTVPCIFIKGGSASEIALVENLIRENLNPIEEAEALQRLKDAKNCKNKDLSEIIGKSEPTISEILSLTRLPESVKKECRTNSKVSRRALVKIAKAGGDEVMEKLFNAYRKKELGGDPQNTKPGEKSTAQAWQKKIDNFKLKLQELDLSDLGEERGLVEAGLRGLVLAIQEDVLGVDKDDFGAPKIDESVMEGEST